MTFNTHRLRIISTPRGCRLRWAYLLVALYSLQLRCVSASHQVNTASPRKVEVSLFRGQSLPTHLRPSQVPIPHASNWSRIPSGGTAACRCCLYDITAPVNAQRKRDTAVAGRGTTILAPFAAHISGVQYNLQNPFTSSHPASIYTSPSSCPSSKSVLPVGCTRLTMSDTWGPPWSNNPYAPQIPSWLYIAEKTSFAGFLIGAIFYGAPIRLSSIRTLSLIYRSRDRYRSILPMYGCIVRSGLSHEGGHQVGSHHPRCGHVRVCDDIHCDQPRYPIHLLYRQPRIL